jgi:hypothetical protein
MAFPIVPAIITLITSLPDILRAVKIIKPIKDKILEVEKTTRDNNTVGIPKPRDILNIEKHAIVAKWVKLHILPNIRRYGFDEYDVDTIIRFIVLFVRKMKKLRRFKG